MTLTLDHIVIAVQDLPQATADYREWGFTVTPGGRHSNGNTENALIPFRDGTYIELIADTGEPPSGAGMDFSVLLGDDEGFTGFALLAAALDERAAVMRAQSMPIGDVQDGSRVTQSGQTLRWKMALIEGTMSPFFIQDVTPRTLRVSDDPQQTQHANGAEGIFDLNLLTRDVIRAIPRYSALLGRPPQLMDGNAVFELENATLTLATAHTDAQRDYLKTHGDAPYQLTLLTTDAPPESLPDARRHGARLDFVRRTAPAVD